MSRIDKTATKEIAAGLTAETLESSKPVSPQIHLIKNASGTRMLVVNGNRLYDISPQLAARLKLHLGRRDEESISRELNTLGLNGTDFISDEPLKSPPLYALSLAIAQKCNMGCTYCYAHQGDFGGQVKNMSFKTALDAIDLLLKNCPEGGKAQLTFLGGEPLINRTTLRQATIYATEQAAKKNITMSFSITSNGTLLREDDAVFFEKYGFSVTISLDGNKDQHNKLRPMKNGLGSYELILGKIKPLLAIQKRMQVSVRVTVTPQNLDLSETLEAFIGMGFHSVGFSPLLNSISGNGEMSVTDLENMLQAMIECGLNFEQNILLGNRYPFLNMSTAIEEVSKGTHRPYPCGAGAGYMGVSADGELSACHRFVNEPAGKMGDLVNGIDNTLQNNWLATRHVHRQDPCKQCWARYLCGGGCHHEVLEKGRNACDYIRGWLHYIIQAQQRMEVSGLAV